MYCVRHTNTAAADINLIPRQGDDTNLSLNGNDMHFVIKLIKSCFLRELVVKILFFCEINLITLLII